MMKITDNIKKLQNIQNEINNNNYNNCKEIYDDTLINKLISDLKNIENEILIDDNISNDIFINSEINENQIENIKETIIDQLSNIKPFHIAILFRSVDYLNGIYDVIEMVNEDVPSNRLTYDYYTVTGTILGVETALKDFLGKYPPTDNLVVIASTSQILEITDNFLYYPNNKER